jgi:nucleoside phosphorylase
VRAEQLSGTVITCGLAGGLVAGMATGAIVVPSQIMTPQGTTIACDEELVTALVNAAQRFVDHVERGPLVTSATLVMGSARQMWADRGYVAADMETGFIKAIRLATIRVILDTPERELSEAWLRPISVLARPAIWSQALWLSREGPRCARLAARVLAAAFG